MHWNCHKFTWFSDVKNQFMRYVYSRSQKAFAAGDAARDMLCTKDELESRQKDIREAFLNSVGGLPPMDTPLNPRIVGTVDCEGFRIEKVRPVQ